MQHLSEIRQSYDLHSELTLTCFFVILHLVAHTVSRYVSSTLWRAKPLGVSSTCRQVSKVCEKLVLLTDAEEV